MTKIILVRHGETSWNKDSKMQSFTDIELSKQGHTQAKKAAQKLKEEKIDIFLTSPLIRAQQTSNHITKYHNKDHNIKEELTERNYGKLEGRNYFEIEELITQIFKENKYEEYEIESPDKFQYRIEKLIKYIFENYKNKTILLTTHSGTCKMILSLLQNKDYLTYRKQIHKKNCSISSIQFDKNNKIKEIKIGEDSHLN